MATTTMLHLQLPPTPPIHHNLHQLQLHNSTTTTKSGLLFREKLLYLENTLHLNSTRALSLNPLLRSTPLDSIISSLSSLSSLFNLSPSDLTHLLSLHPSLLTSHPPSTFLPLSLFLRSVPLPPRPSVLRCPRLLLSSVPLQLSPSLHFLRRLGLPLTPHTSLLLVSDVEKTLIPKLDFIQSLGFSYHETRRLVRRNPGLLTYSVGGNFKPKAEYLVGVMGRDVRELKGFPQYFGCSLEGRIRRRHEACVESGVRMELKEMLMVSDGEFREQLLEKRLRVFGCEEKL